MKSLSRCLLGPCLCVMASCASNQITLEVRSEPGGAKAYINGNYKAVTPCPITFDFSESKYNVLQLAKQGYPVVWATYTREELADKDFIRVPMR